MFVSAFTIDNVIQNKVTTESKQLENLDQGEQVIKSLNGINTTTITFERNCSFYLCVSGANNQFVLYVSKNKDLFMPFIADYGNLFLDNISINVSGTSSKFSKDFVLDLETIIKVAKTYVETGELNDSVEWMQEGS